MQKIYVCTSHRCLSVSKLYMCTILHHTRFVHGRGIPYTPIGTFQDFSYSQRFADLPHLQREKDLSEGRQPTRLYEGPTVVTREGVKPVHSTNLQEEDWHGEEFCSTGNDQIKSKENNERGYYRSRSGEPHDDYVERLINNNAAFEQIVGSVSSSGFGYTRDPRVDPECDNLPPHIRAARHSIMCMQADSAGECIRGVVPPPPCSLKSHANDNECNESITKIQHATSVIKSTELTHIWYRCLIVIIALFSVLLYFGH